MKAAVDRSGIVVGAAQESLIEQEIALWPSILPLLEERQWTLMIAPPRSTGFVTSDRPFSLQGNDPAMSRDAYGIGLGTRDTTITFPISHELAVIGSFERGGGTNVVTEQIVAAVNFTMFQSASARSTRLPISTISARKSAPFRKTSYGAAFAKGPPTPKRRSAFDTVARRYRAPDSNRNLSFQGSAPDEGRFRSRRSSPDDRRDRYRC